MKKHSLTIFSIGHSNRTLDEFLRILKTYGIELVVDVRRFLTSKWEWFKKESIQEALNIRNIRYEYLGDLLGGFRKGGYEKHMKTEEFKSGLSQVKELAKNCRVAMMCSEKIVFKCHRRFISRALQRRGIQVIHIVDSERAFELPLLHVKRAKYRAPFSN